MLFCRVSKCSPRAKKGIWIGAQYSFDEEIWIYPNGNETNSSYLETFSVDTVNKYTTAVLTPSELVYADQSAISCPACMVHLTDDEYFFTNICGDEFEKDVMTFYVRYIDNELRFFNDYNFVIWANETHWIFDQLNSNRILGTFRGSLPIGKHEWTLYYEKTDCRNFLKEFSVVGLGTYEQGKRMGSLSWPTPP